MLSFPGTWPGCDINLRTVKATRTETPLIVRPCFFRRLFATIYSTHSITSSCLSLSAIAIYTGPTTHSLTMADDDTGPCKPDRSKLKRKVVQSLIDHTYYNYSLVNVYEELSRRSSQGQYKNPNRKGLTTNFPAKLHKILSKPEFRHIIRWMVRAMCVFMSVTKMSRLHSDQFMHSRVHSPSHPFPFALMSNMSRSLASRYQNSSSSLMAARGLWLIKI